MTANTAPAHASLAGGEQLAYSITIPAQNAARVIVKQEGIDVSVLLTSPGVERHTRGFDFTSGPAGDETVVPDVLDHDATYDVIVSASLPHAKRGNVTIEFDLAPADAHARAVAAAYHLFTSAYETPGGEATLYRKSLAEYEAAIGAALDAGEKSLAAEATYTSARIHDLLGETPRAIEVQEKALTMFRELGRRDRQARVLNRLGDLSRKVGEVADAQRYFAEALPLAREVGDPAAVADILNNSALVALWCGQWEEAITQLTAAIPLAQEIGSADIESAMTHNIGDALSRVGAYDRAIAAYQRSLELKRSLNLPRRIARTQRSLAEVLFAKGDHEKAIETIRSAIALAEQAGDRVGYAEALGVYGSMLQGTGDMAHAVESFTKALPILSEVKSRGGTIDVLNDWSEGDIARGDADAALQKMDEALPIARATADRPTEARSLYIRALALQKKGQLDPAIDAIKSAVKIVEELRGAIVRSELRTSYLATVRRYFDLYIELTQQKGETKAAFEVSERSHARTLLEGIAESAVKIRKGIDPKLLERQRALQTELNARESYRAQLVLSEGEKSARAAAVAKKIDRLLDEWKEVEAQIRVSSPAWSALQTPEPVSARTVQTKLLDTNTSLIEYHLGDARSYAWVIDRHRISVHELPSRGVIDRDARRYHELLSREIDSLNAADRAKHEARIAEAGRKLAREVWKPLAKRAANKRLLVVPDGALGYVPFAAMPASNDEPLIVAHEIVILPSASVLDTIRRTNRQAAAMKTAAVFADPVFSRNDPRVGGAERESPLAANERSGESYARLHFSRAEANAIIAAASSERAFEALDFAASKKTLLDRDLRKYRILHFATHGSLDTQHPELSGLVLSLVDENGKSVDGFLRLHEIYNLDLDADLVVLSACRTALGKEVYGEGLIGLTRGFMYAGASRVLSSVWNVDDRASAQLMARFYRALLAQHITPAAALRDAQLSLLGQARWASPHYWAAFALQGEWR